MQQQMAYREEKPITRWADLQLGERGVPVVGGDGQVVPVLVGLERHFRVGHEVVAEAVVDLLADRAGPYLQLGARLPHRHHVVRIHLEATRRHRRRGQCVSQRRQKG